MAETTNRSLQTQIPNLRSLHAALDPKSLILSQFSDPSNPQQILHLTTDSFLLERGPRFKEYSDLRDRKLKLKYSKNQPTPDKVLTEKSKNRTTTVLITPPKKQVKFNSTLITPPRRSSSRNSSIVAQSVPDFSSALRKENRKPTLPAVAETGSKSANAGEKRRGGWAGRKSYVNVEELKGLGAAAGNAIRGSGYSKTVLGSRQF